MGFRSLAPALVLVPLLAAPAVASADEGRCAAISGTGFLWEPGVLDSVDPDELQSPDPELGDVPVGLPVDDALACASGAADVRCQPLHESDAPTAPRIGASGPDLMAAPALSSVDERTVTDLGAFGDVRLLGAGRDPSSELLRPPRA